MTDRRQPDATSAVSPREDYTQRDNPAFDAARTARPATREATFFLSHLRPGTITLGLAATVAPGEVVGLDLRPEVVEQARAVAADHGVADIRFEVGSAYALPFPDGAFDAAFAHIVLMHLREPGRALAEIRRVLRPGGVVGVRDLDRGGHVVFPLTPLREQFLALRSRVRQHNGGHNSLGPAYRRLLLDAGFACGGGCHGEDRRDTRGDAAECRVLPSRDGAGGGLGRPGDAGRDARRVRRLGRAPGRLPRGGPLPRGRLGGRLNTARQMGIRTTLTMRRVPMRVLFTALPQAGHFNPLVPIARATRDAGHEVAFACPAGFVSIVEAAGFSTFPAGFEERGQSIRELFPGGRRLSGLERAVWVGSQLFVGVYAAAMAANLLAVCRTWQPDLIVRDSGEFGGCVAAEALGLPHASVRTGALTASYTLRGRYNAALAPVRERAGLDPDPDDAMAFHYLHLAAEPPGFIPVDEGHAPTAHLLRPENFESGDEPLPPWVAALPARPTVYATLGTVVSGDPLGRDTFAAILAGLRDEPYNLVLTVGRENDPAQFGPQPPNVRIARYIPQTRLLPYCDLVVNQGGFSTITGALNAGLPLVVVPLQADQPLNAACCAVLGVGTVVGPEERTPEAIRAAVRAVLADPSYRANAERVRDEMAALPGPEHAVALLERLAVERQPIVAVAVRQGMHIRPAPHLARPRAALGIGLPSL